jgi:anti-sigma factor RsiW
MTEHVTDHLSAYLDDDLGAPERQAVEAHLRRCADCARELEAVRRLVAFAGTVASHDVPPSRNLWPGIQARIERVHQPRRISFARWQLAAAAVVVMAISAGTAWFIRGGIATGPAAATAPAIQADVEPAPAPDLVRPVNFADPQYDAAVADLERTLDERRNDLNPRTVEILERNLKLIDAAIAQARQALEEDPGNAYLNRHLAESRRRKLDLLRRAAAINEAD